MSPDPGGIETVGAEEMARHTLATLVKAQPDPVQKGERQSGRGPRLARVGYAAADADEGR